MRTSQQSWYLDCGQTHCSPSSAQSPATIIFYEVEWNDKPLQDGIEDVYMFMDLEGTSEGPREREEPLSQTACT